MKSSFDDKVLAKMVHSLNKHLPSERKTLSTLLNEEEPAVRDRDNAIYRIKREELELLAGFIPKEDYGKLRLPIAIELTPDYGRGMARVRGKRECTIMRRILEKEEVDEDEIFIHRADVMRVRRKLKTATQYAILYTTL